ncbi:MAG TPA: vWA domain-containing protein [candidate division Zixibacteria bacterium]|nr:vWA domain-containing protein [candidate division Zixibacteria bacterium]
MPRYKALFIISAIILVLTLALPVSAAVANPPLDLACSLNVIFVLDESGSIYGAGNATDIRTDVRDAANGFLDALKDTGSQIAIVEFGTVARLPFGYTPLTSANVASVLTPYVNGVGPDSDHRYEPGDYADTNAYYTNWEDALDMVGSVNAGGPTADLVIFFTDGKPTAHNDGSGGQTISTSNIQPHLDAAEIAADGVKGDGSHIFVLGVPNPDLPEGNIHYISGDQRYADVQPDFSIADYAISTSSDLYDALREIAFALCGGSVSITKTIHDGQDYVNVPGWEFSGTVSVVSGGLPTDYDWVLPEAGAAADIGMTKIGITDEAGTFTWQWKPYADLPTQMVLNESETGVSFEQADCTKVSPDQENEQFTVFTLPVTIIFGLEDFVTCEFRNDADAVDWGDAEDSYKTDKLNQGARHIVLPGAPILGEYVDPEINGQPSLMAENDDLDASPDDEDGVAVPADSNWNDGQGEINITASGPGCLNAWIDFNDPADNYIPDGTFNDAGEHVINNTVVYTGTALQSFALPVGQIHDVSLVMRFRITPLVNDLCFDSFYQDKTPSPTGSAIGGEVEDHIQQLGPTAITLLGVSADAKMSPLPFVAFTSLLALSALILVTVQYRRRLAEQR